MKVTWYDAGRYPRGKADPAFPNGLDIDISAGAARSCVVQLPYPAKRCGHYMLACEKCGLTGIVTTAGRRDDPRSVKVACKGLQ